MKQDGIIEMAKEAGLLPCQGIHTGDLEAFAKLVAKHTLLNIDPSSFMSYQEGFEAGRFAEREACAKWYEDKGWLLDESDVAKAIRARGQA